MRIYEFTNHAIERYVERIILIRKTKREHYIGQNHKKICGIMKSKIMESKVLDVSSLSTKHHEYIVERYGEKYQFLINHKTIFVTTMVGTTPVVRTVLKTGEGMIGELIKGW